MRVISAPHAGKDVVLWSKDVVLLVFCDDDTRPLKSMRARRVASAMRSGLDARREQYRCAIVESARKPLRELMMPIILWLMGVPLVVVVLLMITHVI
jgi:hypothetical protein